MRISIQLRIFAVTSGLCLVIVLGLVSYFSIEHLRRERIDLERKAETYARLLSREVESAIAFDDQETAREVFEAVSVDSDVVAIGLYTGAGRSLVVRGELPPQVAAVREGGLYVSRRASAIRVEAPVISKEGPRGTLLLDLSLEQLDRETRHTAIAAVLAALLALGCALVACWRLSHSLGGRIRAIAEATRAFAEGKVPEWPREQGARDEVSELAAAFSDMGGRIHGLMAAAAKQAADEQSRLTRIVAERTSELNERNAEMDLVLSHVGDGFVTVDRSGRMSKERSAIISRWLGPAAPRATFASYLAGTDESFSAWFQLSFETLLENVLPEALAIDQLPKVIKTPDKHLDVRYTPIHSADGELSRILIVIADATSELERRRAETAQRDLLNLFDRSLRDRRSVRDYFSECGERLETVWRFDQRERASLLRELHTIKGMSGQLGVRQIADLAHELETKLSEEDEVGCAILRDELERSWRSLSTAIGAILGDDARADRCDVSAEDLTALANAVAGDKPKAEVMEMIAGLHREPATLRLHRLAEHARAVAERLGKPAPAVSIESRGVRVDPARFAPFWTAMNHVVRNAVDHGLEDEGVRRERGKPERGMISLSARIAFGELIVEIGDDGGGIDWTALSKKARTLGLPAETDRDLEEALFTDRVSTREVVTEYSGRGVGLGAARAACVELGGRASVIRSCGKGTTFEFRAPLSANPSARAA